MKKRLTLFVLVLALSFSLSVSAFAVDDSNYYSLASVASEPSPAMDWPVSPAVSHDGFLAEDSQNLARIMTDLTTTGMTTLKSYIVDISDALSRGGSIYDFLSDITDALTNQNTHGTLVWYLKHSQLALDSIDTAVSSISAAFSGQGLATENTLSSLSARFTTAIVDLGDSHYDFVKSLGIMFGNQKRNNGKYLYGVWRGTSDADKELFYDSWSSVVGNVYGTLTSLYNPNTTGGHTILWYLSMLQDVLANEDDKLLRDSQKENVNQVKQDFVSGSSGQTSLGKGDFSNASQVGGALSDTFNMGGASKVSDFLSGFGSAGTESQAWFSQTTANNLNAVEAADGTQGVSTFADDGEIMVDVDPDPYNMANIFDRYDWLEGVNMDD
ncbi:hypothetical protein [uncultured Eubacterium sp.]|uniref:hypothetical protein n=1 Tax=uncultured Eubacterium sp. TaxID=165185 RepID=UPI0032663FFE